MNINNKGKIDKQSNLDSSQLDSHQIENLAKILSKQIDKEMFERKYTPTKEIIKLVALGAFLPLSLIIPNLPLALKPFIKNLNAPEPWKRFNIPYLKRTLSRLEKEKLVEITEENNVQVVKITQNGKNKVLRFALDELAVEIPKNWDYKWRLISYDIPEELKGTRNIFISYLKAWKFYPLHESVYLHAYPCEEQVGFLKEYLGLGEYVRIFTVTKIENDKEFRSFFNI